ncbi:MAG: phosphopentomutase, partial [Armatimonadota bacterium]
MRRYLLLVLDGCGAGAAPDAGEYGDHDPVSSTLAHVAHACGGLNLPVLGALGLGAACPMDGVPAEPTRAALTGRLREAGKGKDSVTGHWEITGSIVDPAFPLWPDGIPPDLLLRIGQRAGVRFIGGEPASGTEILSRRGAEHLRTGHPIAYTSADSVLQIAAHEDILSVERLHAVCAIARSLTGVCRVIARPFVGDVAGGFVRTGGRRDFPLPPPPGNLVEVLSQAGRRVHFIGRPGEFYPEAPLQSREATTTNLEHGEALARAVR